MRILAFLALVLILSACSSATSIAVIAVGDCFDDTGDTVITELGLIECGQQHDNEVFANLQVDEFAFPGDDVLSAFAIDACLVPFEAYVGESYAELSLDYWFLTSTERSWAAGDRAVTCVLYAADLSKLIGSARG